MSQSPHENTAVLLIDPYNGYIHPEGKIYELCKESLQATDTITHMKNLVKAARANNIPIFYCLHQQWKIGNFENWKRVTPFHRMLKEKSVCEENSWGAQIYGGLEPDLANGDLVVAKHWNARQVFNLPPLIASAFFNTDLDYQLHQRNITNLVTAGMTCNQCLEMTSRTAIELGYDVTITTNATAGFTSEQKDTAQRLLWGVYFEKVMTVEEWTATLENNV